MSDMCSVPMYVDCMMHKSSIEINEEGTKAVAVTSVSGGETSAAPLPGQNIEFYMDHPYLYYIQENSTGTILFMGLLNSL